MSVIHLLNLIKAQAITIAFKYCISELLTHLHKNAVLLRIFYSVLSILRERFINWVFFMNLLKNSVLRRNISFTQRISC